MRFGEMTAAILIAIGRVLDPHVAVIHQGDCCLFLFTPAAVGSLVRRLPSARQDRRSRLARDLLNLYARWPSSKTTFGSVSALYFVTRVGSGQGAAASVRGTIPAEELRRSGDGPALPARWDQVHDTRQNSASAPLTR